MPVRKMEVDRLAAEELQRLAKNTAEAERDDAGRIPDFCLTLTCCVDL